MKKFLIFSLLSAFSLSLMACADFLEFQNGQRITPSQAHDIINNFPNAIILDVRTQQEFDTERIPGAILLPDFAIETQAPYLLPDLDAIILVYCRSGNRSQSATRLLVSMGYLHVFDFGGIIDWSYGTEK